MAAATLVDEMMAHKCAPLRREKAAGLLQRLAQRNPPAVEYLEVRTACLVPVLSERLTPRCDYSL